MLPVFCMIAFRGIYVGADTPAYYHAYEKIEHGASLLDVSEDSRLEKGYLVYCLILKELGLGTQWVFIVEAAIFVAAVIFFAKNNAKDVIFMLITTSLTLLEFALSGVRQTLVISLFLVAYRFAVNRKLLIYTVLIYLASLFHTSILMIYPLYFLINIHFKKSTIFVYFAILALALMFINRLFYFFNDALGYEYVLEELNAGYISFIASLIFLFMALSCTQGEEKNLLFRPAAHLTIVNTMLGAIRFVNVMAMRIMLYISCFPYLMIDQINDSNPNKKLYKTIAMIYISAYIVYRTFFIDPYYFFWNN